MVAYDRFWQWANKPLASRLTDFRRASQGGHGSRSEDRRDREKVNEAAARRSPTINFRRRTLSVERTVMWHSLPMGHQAGRLRPLVCWTRGQCVRQAERAGS